MEFNNPSTLIKDITPKKEGQAKIISGVNQLATAVKSTLGAGGQCIIYEDALGNPVITKDGVTVAETCLPLWDPIENMGAMMIKEAASKTVTEAGDGTTTATVLAQALLKGITEYKGLDTTRTIKEDIEAALDEVLGYLEDVTVPIVGDMISHVAAISCNNDEELGAIIADAFIKAGLDGEVLMEDSEDEHTTVETTEGVQIKCGLKSQYLRTNPERETAELDNPLVLILTSPLANLRKIQNILEMCLKKNRSILIIGEVEQQPLATLVSNKVKGVLKVNVIDLPGFGTTKQDAVADLALMTGATPISEELGDDMDFIDASVLGEVERSVTSQLKTILQVQTPEGVDSRIADIRKKIKKEPNAYMVSKLEERINILSGAVSLIQVGAKSKIELKEKKDRTEDAIYAVKAAIAEGIVPGGGIALLNASQQLCLRSEPMREGALILAEAIKSPFFAILENAETVLPDPLMNVILSKEGTGVDVVTGEIVDMIQRGIIDPVLVTKTALKNAVSVVKTIVSAGTVISNKRIN